MKVMRQVPRSGAGERPRVMAIGVFDGVHRGHRAVLRRLADLAGERRSESVLILLTGRAECRPPDAPLVLTDLRKRLELLEEQGVDLLVLASAKRLHEFSGLIGRLGVAAMVAGPAGSPERLRLEEVLQRSGCGEIERIRAVTVDGCLVTRRAIHAAIAEARLATAGRLLDRPHSVAGRVVHGHHRGRPLGIPTANLRVRGVRVPPDGVYAVRARVDGVDLRGVANVGFNPTFGDCERAVETHLFDFDDDIYGHRLEVAFVERLREERKFPNVESLIDQIRLDVATARELFSRR